MIQKMQEKMYAHTAAHCTVRIYPHHHGQWLLSCQYLTINKHQQIKMFDNKFNYCWVGEGVGFCLA